MDLHFADPWILLLLIALPALAVFLLAFRGERGVVRVGALTPVARRTWRTRLDPWLPVLRLAAVALLIVGLARPQRARAADEAQGEGIDIVLAYDVSSSMTQPFARGQSRIEAAASVLKDFIDGRDTDRVGLVAFRGSSLALSPLTTDYDAVAEAVGHAPNLQLGDGTAIGVAIGESVNLLRSSQSASRIIILLTDGQNGVHTIEPLEAARIAETLRIRVYTVGVVNRVAGSSTSTLNVDEAAMREISNITGGTYNRAEDPEALARIYDDIDRLEKSRFEDTRATVYDELAPIFLAAAALALALEMLLRLTAFRRPA